MKMPFRSILTLAFVAGFFALTASAQKPALIRNQDEPGRTQYQQTYFIQQSNTHCTTAQSCTVLLPAVPVGYSLVVTNVSGLFRVTSGTGAYATIHTNSLSPEGIGFLAASQINATTFVISSPTMYFIAQGEVPLITLQADNIDRTGYGAYVTVVGYLIALN